MPEWLKGADCKSAGLRLRWFESNSAHHFSDPIKEPSGSFFVEVVRCHGRRAKNACRASVIRAWFVRPHADWTTQSECHSLIVPHFSQSSSALLRTSG